MAIVVTRTEAALSATTSFQSMNNQFATPVPPLAACAIAGPIKVASPSWSAVPVNLNPEQKSAPVPTLLTPIEIELICDTPEGTTKLSPELAN